MSYAKKAVFGSAYTFISLIIANLAAYFTRIYLSRNLGVEDYGLFYAVFNFIIFFLFFRDMGLNTVVAKFLPEYNIKKKYNELKSVLASVLSIQLFTTFILCVILFFLSSFLAENYFKNPKSIILINIFIFYIFFSIFLRFLKAFFVGSKKFFLSSLLDPLKNVMVLLGILLFFNIGFGVYSPAISFILSIIIIIFLFSPFFFSLYNPFKFHMKNYSAELKKVFIFGLPMVLASLGGHVIGYLDTLMLTYFTSLRDVGIYNVILPSALIFLFFGRSVSTVMMPIISELFAKKEWRKQENNNNNR